MNLKQMPLFHPLFRLNFKYKQDNFKTNIDSRCIISHGRKLQKAENKLGPMDCLGSVDRFYRVRGLAQLYPSQDYTGDERLHQQSPLH